MTKKKRNAVDDADERIMTMTAIMVIALAATMAMFDVNNGENLNVEAILLIHIRVHSITGRGNAFDKLRDYSIITFVFRQRFANNLLCKIKMIHAYLPI